MCLYPSLQQGEPIIDYTNSFIMTSIEYMVALQDKAMRKECIQSKKEKRKRKSEGKLSK